MNKVAKSSMTKVITKQYKNFSEPILFTGYPPGWSVQYCLIEGIFLINTAPLGVHITYLCGLCQVLLQRHISLHFNKGCIEVHFIYDNPGQLKNTPKCFESMRRDGSVTVATTRTCDKIHKKVRLPRKWWEEVINCRTCKQTLVFLLAKYLLKIAQTYLLPNQTFYVQVAVQRTREQQPGLSKLAMFHNQTLTSPEMQKKQTLGCVCKTQCFNIIVMSPDADVYIIGLPLQCTREKNILV